MNESSREDILTLIKSLKLTGMMEAYDDIIAHTLKRKGTHRPISQSLKPKRGGNF